VRQYCETNAHFLNFRHALVDFAINAFAMKKQRGDQASDAASSD
jgi:hypothetical protein